MNRRLRTPLRLTWLLLGLACLLALLLPSGSSDAAGGDLPNVLVVTVDTLRTDRLSAYGYRRPTSPNLDRLLQGGARLTQARTVEPLTNPALSSMLTSLYPHEHGGTRNGLKMRLGLDSLPKTLAGRGWQTAAFVGNWTLRHQLSGLGEHFDLYEEVLTKRRWFGLFKGEADADDVTAATIEWLDAYGGRRRPFFVWAHYVDPHAPYVFHEDFAERLGIRGDDPSKSDRYDTEVAFVDYHVGRLLDRVAGDSRLRDRTIIVFAADHGESLGEHGYWGHGRNLHEPNLHIPMGFAWPGRIAPRVIEAPAVLIEGSAAYVPVSHRVDNIVTVAQEDPLISGVAWPESLERVGGSAYLVSEPVGRGSVITFADEPHFRLFWRSTLPLFLNAVLYSPSFPR